MARKNAYHDIMEKDQTFVDEQAVLHMAIGESGIEPDWDMSGFVYKCQIHSDTN